MTISARDDADLRRWLEKELQTPGVMPLPSLPFQNVKFGAVTVTWPGESESFTPLTVTHGVGKKPTSVLALAADASVNCGAPDDKVTDTTFQLQGRRIDGDSELTGTLVVFWGAFV